MPFKRVRDPIHGFIEPPTRVVEAIDTPEFQRLRGIGQLALTYLVYPGARHSRFEHGLGTLAAAQSLVDALQSDPRLTQKEAELTEMAALLHDIGHGPFSHVIDGVMKHLGRHGVHEKISRGVIERRLQDVFDSQDELNFVVNLIDPPLGQRSVFQDIVSGPSDADRMDYLLRDSHYCGVSYGRFDLDRLLETAVVVESAGQTQLGFEEGGLYAVEGLLLARRSMHRQVYRHSTRRATDLMLIRALVLALESGDVDIRKLVPADDEGSPVVDDQFLHGFLDLDDETVRRHLETIEGPPGEIGRALRVRDLVHEVVQVDQKLINSLRSSLWLGRILDPSRMTRETLKAVEQSVAADIGSEEHWIHVTVESENNPLYRTPGSDERPGDIIITRQDQPEERFQELSEIWSGHTAGPSYTYISLFTKRQELDREPYSGWDRMRWARYLLDKVDEFLPQ